MRAIVCACCIVLFFPLVALGKPLYVKCFRQVTLRASASSESASIATLKTGQVINLVGEEGEFFLVTLPNGTKGYVRKAFMTNQAPAETRVQEAEQKLQELETRTQAQEKELLTLRAQEKELLALRAERAQCEAAKKQAEATASQQTELAAQLQAQLSAFERNSQFRWFLTGAGILLTGWGIGWLGGASRRRDRSSRLRL
ncbi:MAG: TIGR04211 family SH3 domain-containing protein [Candidatus Binatia bacterium]